MCIIGDRRKSSLGCKIENFVLARMPTFGCMFVYIMCLPCVILGISGTLAMDTLDLEMVVSDEENICRYEDQGTEPGYTCDFVINSCLERLLSLSRKTTQFVNVLWHWR